jgi:hypothetical protein
MHAGTTCDGVEVSVELQAPAALPTVSTDSSLGGPRSQSGYFGQEKNGLKIRNYRGCYAVPACKYYCCFIGD